MKTFKLLAMAAAFASFAACNKPQSTANGAANTVLAQTPGKTYSGTGTVQSITGDRFTIAHGPIAGIGWPAMTMTFTAPNDMVAGVKVKSRVDFSFRQDGSTYVLTSIKPI